MTGPNNITRRSVLASGAALAATPLVGFGMESRPAGGAFPEGFLWGASTAGHQVEGNSTASDLWYLEHATPSPFAEPSGDACNSLELWPEDLDIVRDVGLNAYRFSIEWARIEPEEGFFSLAMLDHYKRIVAGCRARGLVPVVTFNHFVTPRWFAARGGWTNSNAPSLFARFCERAAKHLGDGIGYAVTLNEPQLIPLLSWVLPEAVGQANREALSAAAEALGVPKYSTGNVMDPADIGITQKYLLEAHALGKAAIKAVRPELPVGVSLAIEDDQAVGSTTVRDRKRAEAYGPWLALAGEDDFLGVQNYTRSRFDADGPVPAPEGAPRSQMGMEIYPPSLGNTVRYAHDEAGVPILVTEHGVASEDDSVRQAFIPAALEGLKATIDDGVPVLGYLHWTLLDNFEWIFGYRPKFGLVAVDRQTFERTPKPSAALLGDIARRNGL
jgi:beta-glucosidase